MSTTLAKRIVRLCVPMLLLLATEPARAQLPGLTITGDPASQAGATWTYTRTVDSVAYDLRGILFRPAQGSAPFPAVIINHGTGGNAFGYSRAIARRMVEWGYVCIATNLCHAGGVPIGSPGDSTLANFGASESNYRRVLACRDILAALGVVDTLCLAVFGHSRGAFTSTGVVAAFPSMFSCAGHTAGGVSPEDGATAPSAAQAAAIRCPYIIHHGDADNVVPLAMDELLRSVLANGGVTHEFHVYPGVTHAGLAQDSVMFARTREFFETHICVKPSSIAAPAMGDAPRLYPNPTSGMVHVVADDVRSVQVFTLLGVLVASERGSEVDMRALPPGVYTVRVETRSAVTIHRILR